MESARVPLICLLGVALFFMYQAWQADQQPIAPAETEAPLIDPLSGFEDELPSIDQAPDAVADVDTDQPEVAAIPASTGDSLLVSTDVMRVRIDALGGTVSQVDLLDYTTEAEGDVPLSLLHRRQTGQFLAQTGLLGSGGDAPTHQANFVLPAKVLRLEDGQDRVTATLRWTGANGQRVDKVFTFHRGRYTVDVDYTVQAPADWAVSPYVQFNTRNLQASSDGPPFIEQFNGVAWYAQKDGGDKYKFQKRKFEKLGEEPLDVSQSGGWLAVMQHYFFAAALPNDDEAVRLVAKPAKQGGQLTQLIGAKRTVSADAAAEFGHRLYFGPKLQNRLGDVAPGLQLTVDYGLLTVLSEPLFWVLDRVHDIVANWGVAIILLTLAIKLIFYKLSEAQYRSMAKMRKFAPRIQSIKDRYGDDREQMQKAMMDLYKKEGFNPLAGCWPMLVQFPVFIALYWVLLESVELRHAPFALWLQDLSAPDPFYILPVLFGVSMYFQQKLSGQAMTMDPMQQRIMTAMPIALTAFFAFFPSGLVLYWLVSNLWGIAQQWYIYRKLDNEGLGRKA